jgi:hypothetical protein
MDSAARSGVTQQQFRRVPKARKFPKQRQALLSRLRNSLSNKKRVVIPTLSAAKWRNLLFFALKNKSRFLASAKNRRGSE